ncbi:MAG: RHS repeat-associated core domain-containing protein [Microthrixaceae bacterium]
MPTVEYQRDATDRIVSRTATGEPVVRYGHTGGSDSPQVTLDASNVVTQVSLGLPGGAVLHVTPGVGKRWSYPNLQGSTAAQADDAGAKTGGTFVYDPDGVPTAGGLPDTRPGQFDDTWMGGHQRPLEHATGLQPVIEMGARQYHPVLARFLETDPIEGGTNNDYTYPTDPTNQTDLNGQYVVGTCGVLAGSSVRWHYFIDMRLMGSDNEFRYGRVFGVSRRSMGIRSERRDSAL